MAGHLQNSRTTAAAIVLYETGMMTLLLNHAVEFFPAIQKCKRCCCFETEQIFSKIVLPRGTIDNPEPRWNDGRGGETG